MFAIMAAVAGLPLWNLAPGRNVTSWGTDWIFTAAAAATRRFLGAVEFGAEGGGEDFYDLRSSLLVLLPSRAARMQ